MSFYSDGTLRVRGRLQQSNFEFDKKHPSILDSGHYLINLIFHYEHTKLLHAGPQFMLSSIRERFWPISGRNLGKKVVHNCVQCFKHKPSMGNMHKDRLVPRHPFHTTGVDYAGPLIIIKDRKGRGCKSWKCYICLFVCFSTKCIHLTPSHFLIGRSMTSLPESNLTSISENRLNLFQKIEQMRQHFLRSNR